MEHLWTENHFKPDSVGLQYYIESFDELKKELITAEQEEAVLLQIEIQSVVQVLIEQLALRFDPSQLDKLGEVEPLLDDLNRLLTQYTPYVYIRMT
jgi:hypothetical protein